MAVEIKIPSPGESITEVEIATWHKRNGDYVNDGDELLEIESDKATLPVFAEGSGVLKVLAEEGDTVEVGSVVCAIDTDAAAPEGGAAPAAEAPAAAPAAAQPASGSSNAQGHPSPAAAKILAEKDVAPADVAGTGPGGRILKVDAMGAQVATASAPVAESAAAPPPPPPAGSRIVRREKMSALRRKIAERLVAVKNETAMLTTFNEVDLGSFMDVRKKYKELFKETHEVGLGFMSIFTKACCEALRKFPAVNAQIDGNEMVFHDYSDIAIAVSAPKGLMVPVIRNAESLTLDGIEKEVVRLAGKARTGSLSIDEMQGGTFTITNGGVFGSLMSTPIINPPQSAILGMHKIQQRPMDVNGEIKLRPMMYLALSYDHRIIDGKESVSFLVRVKELLEDPIRLLLGV